MLILYKINMGQPAGSKKLNNTLSFIDYHIYLHVVNTFYACPLRDINTKLSGIT